MSNSNQPSPENIMKMGTAFWPSKILLTAVNLELFTMLSKKESMSASAIKTQLNFKCTDRHVFDFLDTLAGLGFLNRTGLLNTAKYSNTIDTDIFLDKNKPSYIGGMLEMLNNRLYDFWSNLEEGLMTGLPQNEAKTGGNLFEALYADPEVLKEFISAMGSIQMGNFMAFAQKFDFATSKTLVDIGGSGGLLSLMVAKYNDHMNCISADLPSVEPIAKGNIQQHQLQNRVKTTSVDFFKDDFPKADIITMGNILHDWDEETKIKLIQKAYDALPESGALVAIENIIDDERKENVFGLMMSINMLIETGNGFDYSFDDFNKWAKIVGFKSTKLIPLAGPASAVIAYK